MKSKDKVIILIILSGFLIILPGGGCDQGDKPLEQFSYWLRTYDNGSSEFGYAIQATSDGGSIVTGSIPMKTAENGGGSEYRYGTWVLKLSYFGSVEWHISIGTSDADYAESVLQTADGGYLVMGEYGWLCGSWAVKLSPDGEIEWYRAYETTDCFEESLNSIMETTDGGFIASGSYNDQGFHDIWVVKLTQDGDIEWIRKYGFPDGHEYARSISPAADGGYIVAGFMEYYPETLSIKHDAWILKFSTSGELEWQKSYSRYGNENACTVYGTSDGGAIFAGETYSGEPDDYTDSIWIVKLDHNGAIQWQKMYNGGVRPMSIVETPDRHYIVGTFTIAGYDGYQVDTDFTILKLDENGNIKWQKSFGGEYDDRVLSVAATPDGGCIATGHTESMSNSSSRGDMFVLRLSPQGTISDSCPSDAVWVENDQVEDSSSSPVDTAASIVELTGTASQPDYYVSYTDAAIDTVCGGY